MNMVIAVVEKIIAIIHIIIITNSIVMKNIVIVVMNIHMNIFMKRGMNISIPMNTAIIILRRRRRNS